MRCCCVVRQFRTDGATCDEHLTSELDILAGRHSVSSSLGAVTSRRIKDEVNAARKVELVITNSHFSVLSLPPCLPFATQQISVFFSPAGVSRKGVPRIFHWGKTKGLKAASGVWFLGAGQQLSTS